MPGRPMVERMNELLKTVFTSQGRVSKRHRAFYAFLAVSAFFAGSSMRLSAMASAVAFFNLSLSSILASLGPG